MEQLLRDGSVVYESARKTRDGGIVPVEISSSLTDVDGELLVLSISRDISDRKKIEEELERAVAGATSSQASSTGAASTS